jgi:MFS family permease
MRSKNRIIILIVASALFMQNLESHVLGTALPEIARALRTDPINLHMTLTAYLLSLAVFMPVSGWFADRYGTRNVFRAAIAVFVLASVACAFAPSLGWLVTGRIAQGVGGAMMTPVARLALLKAVPRREILNAMTWVTIPAMLGPIAGPPLGGFIVTYWSWPWIFWVNVPIGILGIIPPRATWTTAAKRRCRVSTLPASSWSASASPAWCWASRRSATRPCRPGSTSPSVSSGPRRSPFMSAMRGERGPRCWTSRS